MVKIAEVVGIETIIVAIVFAYFFTTHTALFIKNYKYNCFDYNVSNTINVSQLPNDSALTIQQNFIFKNQNNNYLLIKYAYDPFTHQFFIENWKNGNMTSEKVFYKNLNTNIIHLNSSYTNGGIIVSFNNETFTLKIPQNYTEVLNDSNSYGYYNGIAIEIDSNNRINLPNFYCDWSSNS